MVKKLKKLENTYKIWYNLVGEHNFIKEKTI